MRMRRQMMKMHRYFNKFKEKIFLSDINTINTGIENNQKFYFHRYDEENLYKSSWSMCSCLFLLTDFTRNLMDQKVYEFKLLTWVAFIQNDLFSSNNFFRILTFVIILTSMIDWIKKWSSRQAQLTSDSDSCWEGLRYGLNRDLSFWLKKTLISMKWFIEYHITVDQQELMIIIKNSTDTHQNETFL